jgi:N-acetylglutamate synthase
MIRKMTTNDYEMIYDLWMNTPGMGLNTIDDSKEGIEKFLNRNPNTNFVALHNDKIIGVIMSGHDGRRGFIYHMAVAVEHRKQGIGKHLVQYCMDALKQEGINKAVLVVFSKNDLGNAFWEKQGFYNRTDLNYRDKSMVELIRIDT